MIKYFHRSVREERLVELDKFRKASWVYVTAPGPDELKYLSEEHGLDADLLRDALDPDEIPRVEYEEGVVYLYMRYAYRVGENVETDPVLLAVGENFVATVSRHPLPRLDRLINSSNLFTTQRAKLLLILLRHITDSYEHNLVTIDRQIRKVRANLSVATVNNKYFVQFVTIEDALSTFLAELVPTSLLLSSLLSGRYGLTFYEEDKDLIEDLVQATRQLTETSRSSLRTIVNIREAYSNIMSNNLNRRVEVLTSLTVVLTIPTIIFSALGMNVPVPGSESRLAFTLIVVFTLSVMAAILYWLYRRRWL